MTVEKISKPKRLQEVIDDPEWQKKYKAGGKSNLEAYNAYSADYQASQGMSLQADAKAAKESRQQAANDNVSKLTASAAAKNGASAKVPGAKKDFFTNFANGLNNTAGDVNNALGAVDEWAIRQINISVAQSSALSNEINEASSSVTKGIAGVGVALEGTINGLKAELNEALKPVSTAIGSTAMMVENIARNPLGAPQLLAQGAVALLDKVSPELASQIEGASKSINLENLANLPGQMMGSIRNLTMAADALLSVPFTIVSDIYNGLMDIMEEIANLIDSAVSAVFDLFFGPGGLLDSIIPISEILSMLEAIGELASFVGGIAGLAGGFNMVTNITGQITGAVSNISSALQNPLQFIPGVDQVTGGIGQITSALRNPEQFLPPEIGQQIQKISSIPGLGFVSNFGTSIGGTLDGLSQGIFTKVLDNYSKQIPMLAPLVGQPVPSGQQALYTQESYEPTYQTSKINGAALTQMGVVQEQDTGPRKIFEQGQAYGMTGTVGPNGQYEVTGSVQNMPGFGGTRSAYGQGSSSVTQSRGSDGRLYETVIVNGIQETRLVR